MDVAALIIAAGALVVAYLALHRANAQAHETNAAREAARQVQADLNETRAGLQARLDELCRDAQRQAGQLKFTPGMTIAQALALHPGVNAVLTSFNLAGCSNCAVSDVDTLEGACRSYGIDQEALMAALSRLVTPAADPVKPINVSRMRVEM